MYQDTDFSEFPAGCLRELVARLGSDCHTLPRGRRGVVCVGGRIRDSRDA